MIAFLRCVAEAVAENGIRGLADIVPGGAFAGAVAAGAWKKYRARKSAEEAREEIRQLAGTCFEEARAAAAEAAALAAPAAAAADRMTLELYLTNIPGAVRASLRRPEDASGTTVPAAFALDTLDDLARLLPARPARFRPADPVPGLPMWALAEPLGSGGFGEVWLATHTALPSLRGAVKFCHREHARDLRHESGLIDRVMAAGRHPNIVPLTNAHLNGDDPWLMYEYVRDGDLGLVVLEWAGLSNRERVDSAVAALRELAGAVDAFHRLDPPVVHRDLKPANILWDATARRLRVTDFGIGGIAAGATDGQNRLLTSLRGSHTPLYASPQQHAGGAPDPRDDVHALGVIGFQMITGQLDRGAGPDFAEDLREAGAGEELIALLGRCVAQKEERRPATAGVLLAALGPAPVTVPASATLTVPPDLPPGTTPESPPEPDAAAFVNGFRALRRLHDNWRKLLRAHYHAPQRTATATELAAAVGYTTDAVLDMQYGRLASTLATAMGYTGDQLSLVADVLRPPDGAWQYVMRPTVAAALKQLDWV